MTNSEPFNALPSTYFTHHRHGNLCSVRRGVRDLDARKYDAITERLLGVFNATHHGVYFGVRRTPTQRASIDSFPSSLNCATRAHHLRSDESFDVLINGHRIENR